MLAPFSDPNKPKELTYFWSKNPLSKWSQIGFYRGGLKKSPLSLSIVLSLGPLWLGLTIKEDGPLIVPVILEIALLIHPFYLKFYTANM